MFSKDITKRRDEILEIIIYSYVHSALPVGSRHVAKIMGLSSATIRNVMSDLEELGLITHPHTSAGRIPTDKGYRCYIESLMRIKDITKQEARRIRQEYHLKRKGIDDIIKKTAEVLSSITHHTGLVLFPRLKESTFEHIDLIPISRRKVLVVLVTSTGIVRNFIIETKEELGSDMPRIATILNTECYGMTLGAMKTKLLTKAQQERDSSVRELERASRIIESALKVYYENELFLEGTSCLLSQPEFEDAKIAKSVLQLFEDKNILSRLVEEDLSQDGIRIHIGRENKHPYIQNCSIVTSGYRMKDEMVGRLGIIGPTRMEYSHLIPLVNFVSATVTETLNDLME